MALAEFTSQCRSWVETVPGYEVRSTSQTPALHRGHFQYLPVPKSLGGHWERCDSAGAHRSRWGTALPLAAERRPQPGRLLLLSLSSRCREAAFMTSTYIKIINFFSFLIFPDLGFHLKFHDGRSLVLLLYLEHLAVPF